VIARHRAHLAQIIARQALRDLPAGQRTAIVRDRLVAVAATGLDRIETEMRAALSAGDVFAGSIPELTSWLATDPARADVEAALAAERDGRKRKGALEALEAALAEE
jgi:hypothetical protein